MKDFQKDNAIKKLISNSRAIITNQIGLPLGLMKMDKIVGWFDDSGGIEGLDLSLFSRIMKEISDHPIGSERLHYQIDLLLSKDEDLDKVILENKAKIIRKCFEIIEKLS